MSLFGVILVPIFPHWDGIRREKEYSLYSARMRENAEQNNSECGHFSRSDYLLGHEEKPYTAQKMKKSLMKHSTFSAVINSKSGILFKTFHFISPKLRSLMKKVLPPDSFDKEWTFSLIKAKTRMETPLNIYIASQGHATLLKKRLRHRFNMFNKF